MLCPAKDDPNREKELKRFKEDPHAFGAPKIQTEQRKNQRANADTGK